MSWLVVGLVVLATVCWPTGGALRTVAAPRSRPPWSRPRRVSPVEELEELARTVDLLAMTLRSGATPTTAVRVVAAESASPWSDVLHEVHERLGSGAPAGPLWRSRARERPELRALAGAWTLSEELGVSLAPSMTTSAQVLRARVQARRRLDAATAGARATMRMLTLLPLAGLLGGFAFGLTPWDVYGHSAVTAASAAVGLVLTGVGWLVCRRVLARAVAPVVHR